ncbi:MAG: hypothetical protein AAGH68_04130 [Pseudomonadota bacterium]
MDAPYAETVGMGPDFQTFQSNSDLRLLSGMMSDAANGKALTAPGELDWARVEELAADSDSPDFAPATASLIRGALRGRVCAESVAMDWEVFDVQICGLQSDFRSVFAIRFRRLGVACPEPLRRRADTNAIRSALQSIATAMTHKERDSIARSEGNRAWQEHFDALDKVIDEQNCEMTKDQSWCPSEAIELCAWDPERQGFWGATALLLIAGLGEPDYFAADRWGKQAECNLALDYPARAAILATFRHCYEVGERLGPEFRGWRRKDPHRPMVAIPWAAPEYLIGAGHV